LTIYASQRVDLLEHKLYSYWTRTTFMPLLVLYRFHYRMRWRPKPDSPLVVAETLTTAG